MNYKWIATKGERNNGTVGVGFGTKAEAEQFAKTENRRHGSGYRVVKVADARNPKFV